MTHPSGEVSPRHVLYLLVAAGVFLFTAVVIAATWLLSPWAATALALLWLAGVWMSWRSWRDGPWAPLGWSVLVAVAWVVTVVVGTSVGNWRA